MNNVMELWKLGGAVCMLASIIGAMLYRKYIVKCTWKHLDSLAMSLQTTLVNVSHGLHICCAQ